MAKEDGNLESQLDWAHSTRTLHADSHLRDVLDVAPPLHVTTTFKYTEDMVPLWERPSYMEGDRVYSRLNAPTTTRYETVLESVIKGKVITYSSGCAAFHALLVHLNPKRLFMTPGFSGTKHVASLVSRLSGMEVHPLDAPPIQIQADDLIHLETPLNPTGMALSIRYYADLAHSFGAFLSVDSSLGPPGLQDPFAFDADIVMHSGTKYLGGHSDLLCGVLSVRREDWALGLQKDRIHLGSVMGNMESWLGVRSLRTLDLRVQRQSETAEKLVKWISDCLASTFEGSPEVQVIQKVVLDVKHASLQRSEMEWLKKQMPNGFGPVFSIMMREDWMAKQLPSKLALFHHTCSFGSVDSLIEWRRLTDQSVDPRILKFSIGLECWEDLKGDLLSAFQQLEDAS